jgi:hypothetical protein
MTVDTAYLQFSALLAAQPDVYLGNEGALYAAYGANSDTPAAILSQAINSRAVICYLIGDSLTSRPAVFLAPFSFKPLPGVASIYDNTSYGFLGDVNASRPNPSVMRLDNVNLFNLTAHVWVPTVATMLDMWTATDVAENQLPFYTSGSPDVEHVRSRQCAPIPHCYAADVVKAYGNGTLTWRSLWSTVGVTIAGDPVQLGHYQGFLDCVRVGSNLRAQVTSAPTGAPTFRTPESEKAAVPALANGTLGEQVMDTLYALLPGHRAPTGIGQHLQALALSQQAQEAARIATATAVLTLKKKNPIIAGAMMAYCEVAHEDDLPSFWSRDLPVCTKAGGQQQLSMRMIENASRLHLPVPILSLTFATDIITGRIQAGGVDNVTRGLSIFRVRTNGTDDALNTDAQNLVYNLVSTGSGGTNGSHLDMTELVLRNKEIPVIDNDLDFIATIRAYYVVLLTVLGVHSRVTQAYADYVLPQVEDFATTIRARSHEAIDRRTAYMKILLYIWRVTEAYVVTLASTPSHARGNLHPPDYALINSVVQGGRVNILTELTRTLFDLVRTGVGAPTSGGTPDAPPTGPPPRGGAPPSRAPGSPHPDLRSDSTRNLRLKQAWTALGNPSIYRRAGDRYWDPRASNVRDKNRGKVLADDGTTFLCLPWCLLGTCFAQCGNAARHNTLTTSEEDRVAAAATPPFAL